jgi:hypothetical protein
MDTPEQKPQPSGLSELRKKSVADKQKEKDSLVSLWMQDLHAPTPEPAQPSDSSHSKGD